jgi:hypothetical protein
MDEKYYKILVENVDSDIYSGFYYVMADDEAVITREGRVNSDGEYDNHHHIGMCTVCLGARLEWDTGFECLHCGASVDIESGPNRLIFAPGIGEILINSIGERL